MDPEESRGGRERVGGWGEGGLHLLSVEGSCE